MPGKVFITGLGSISAIGDNVQQTYQSLKQSKSGIGKISILNTRHKHLPTGEVKYTDRELMDLAKISSDGYYSRTSLLGMIAAREAYQSARLGSGRPKRIGFISATTVGGMDKTETYYNEYFQDDDKNPHLNYIDINDCGDSTEKIAAHLGVTDFITTISTACSSSANAIMLGARLIRHNLLDSVIAGGTDALSLFTLNGFHTLKILDEQPCKPFDENRRGLNLGEGAGYIVLESDGTNALCELKGYANANDAFHETGSSPEGDGALAAMKKAAEVAEVAPGDIDYVNVHGTGTENNDLSEGRAMQRFFEKIPDFSSTKAFTGHTLGAAGGIEAVFSVLSLMHGEIFPNLNFATRMKELNFSPAQNLKAVKVNHVMSNSFGFGGNNTVLILGRS